MLTQGETNHLLVPDLARLAEPLMAPLGDGFFYYTLPPMPDEDVKPYLYDPVEALPPAVRKLIAPPVRILLVPHLEQVSEEDCRMSYQPPAADQVVHIVQNLSPERLFMVLAIGNEPVPDYHHTLYRALTHYIAGVFPLDLLVAYETILLSELEAGLHGEVDETSWLLKQQLNGKRTGKKYELYFRASLEDTLALYLHGICCDLDVERGPRQIASRHLRRRLECLFTFFPPPAGRAVFPEQLRP